MEVTTTTERAKSALHASSAIYRASRPEAALPGAVMSEPASSAAGGIALWKIAGGILGIGAVASALGFMVLLPKTPKEAAVRILATMAGSALLGPMFVAWAYYEWPHVFGAAAHLAENFGMEPWCGMFMVASPILAMAGLPFWWLLGAGVLWLDRRKGQDLGQMARDAAADVKAIVP